MREEREREGARERGREGAREQGSKGARERGSEGAKASMRVGREDSKFRVQGLVS